MDRANRWTIFETAAGFCAIVWSDAGVTGFHLPVASDGAAARRLRRRAPDADPADPPPRIAETVAAASRYFLGAPTDLSDVVLDLAEADAPSRRIYAAARQVGWGQTTTYGALARAVGAGPEAAREVGRAMARNPVPLIIPCHRVLAAGGRLGGFSAPGGAAAKARMLELEGVRLAPPPPAQRSFGF